mmetsp:Transcript_101033/g.263911  ORF Transcript_101033/g.263911 Transcript_101033/m.263911 type:complete len:261 (-) Transcript_101033:205-987(-)
MPWTTGDVGGYTLGDTCTEYPVGALTCILGVKAPLGITIVCTATMDSTRSMLRPTAAAAPPKQASECCSCVGGASSAGCGTSSTSALSPSAVVASEDLSSETSASACPGTGEPSTSWVTPAAEVRGVASPGVACTEDDEGSSGISGSSAAAAAAADSDGEGTAGASSGGGRGRPTLGVGRAAATSDPRGLRRAPLAPKLPRARFEACRLPPELPLALPKLPRAERRGVEGACSVQNLDGVDFPGFRQPWLMLRPRELPGL